MIVPVLLLQQQLSLYSNYNIALTTRLPHFGIYPQFCLWQMCVEKYHLGIQELFYKTPAFFTS